MLYQCQNVYQHVRHLPPLLHHWRLKNGTNSRIKNVVQPSPHSHARIHRFRSSQLQNQQTLYLNRPQEGNIYRNIHLPTLLSRNGHHWCQHLPLFLFISSTDRYLYSYLGISQSLVLSTGVNLISEVVGSKSKSAAFVFGFYGMIDKIVVGLGIYFVGSTKAYSISSQFLT